MPSVDPTKVMMKGPRILVKLLPIQTKFGGRICMPDNLLDREQGATRVGVVLAMGDLCFKAWGNGEPWCKIGDTIYFSRYAGDKFTDERGNSMNCITINDEDMFGVVPEDGIITYEQAREWVNKEFPDE